MRRQRQSKNQSSIFDFDFSEEEKKQILEEHISHENHIENSQKIKEEQELLGEELLKKLDDQYLRAEQIIVSKDNYPSISMSDNKSQFNQSIDSFSLSCHKSKNILNQCLYQIRQAFFNKIDQNIKNDKEKELRINIRSIINKYKNYSYEKLQKSNYKNAIYKLLDKYFKDESKNRDIDSKANNNYSWSPQAAQQIIDISVEAWLDNDLARRDYKDNPHRKYYTGEPGLPNYRKNLEYISVFTNQQCHIERKDMFVEESMNEEKPRWIKKNFLTFPDHLGIKPIDLGNIGRKRLSPNTDLREVRIIPLTIRGYYKIELIYKKVIDEEFKRYLKSLNLNKENIIGIDLGKVNTVTIANNIEKRPIVVKGGFTISISQWYNKISSKLYEIYYKQQKFTGQKGQKIKIGNKLEIQIQNRYNRLQDIFHKLSRYIIDYCIQNKIGTIIIGRNPFWKQNINMGKENNQNFVYIPFDLFIRMMKYKGKEIGIDVFVNEEAHTSKCSFLDKESICHHDKYMGERLTQKGHRGLFRTKLGRLINSDVNGAYNIIRKVRPDAFDFKGHGTIVGEVLHPMSIGIKDLLSSR